jgi:hypothetical protein
MTPRVANYQLYLPVQLAEIMHASMNMRGAGKDGKRWTIHDFVRVAIAEKCARMYRSRRHQIRNHQTDLVEIYLQDVKHDSLAELGAPCADGQADPPAELAGDGQVDLSCDDARETDDRRAAHLHSMTADEMSRLANTTDDGGAGNGPG